MKPLAGIQRHGEYFPMTAFGAGQLRLLYKVIHQ